MSLPTRVPEWDGVVAGRLFGNRFRIGWLESYWFHGHGSPFANLMVCVWVDGCPKRTTGGCMYAFNSVWVLKKIDNSDRKSLVGFVSCYFLKLEDITRSPFLGDHRHEPAIGHNPASCMHTLTVQTFLHVGHPCGFVYTYYLLYWRLKLHGFWATSFNQAVSWMTGVAMDKRR